MTKLEEENTLSCGTVNQNRSGLPKDAKKTCAVVKSLKRGDSLKRMKGRMLAVTWRDTRIVNVLCNVPGYLGDGAIRRRDRKGWVSTLAGGQKPGANGFMFFIVNVDLSEEGIEHTDDIVALTFQYLNMLRKAGPQEWVFRECQNLNSMAFRFKDKERPRNYTCSVAGALHDYPLKEVLSGGYLIDEWRPELINTVMEKLTPESIRVMVIGKKFEGHTDLKETWYGTEYSLVTIPDKKIKEWSDVGIHDKLCLPDQNEFIPTNFDLLTRESEPTVLPVVIRDSQMTKVWYKQDDKYLMPKACINVEFFSPHAYMDPLCTNLTYMFVALFKDALNEYAYAAELAGLGYDLHNTIYGLTLSLKGYNDKQHILLQKVIEKMTSFKIDGQRFDILKENYERGLKNFKAEQPHQHAIYYTSALTSEQVWTKDELLDALDEVTLEKLEAFIPQLLSRLYLEMLVYGNVTRELANKLADMIENILAAQSKTKPLLPSQQRRFREVQLPDGCYYVYRQTNEVHKSSSLEVYYQCSVQQTESNMLLELFCQIIGEPCFDILRTQEQLGYIVFSGVRRSNNIQGLRVIVQSDRSPEYVEQRIEAFLHKMESYIQDLSEEQFQKHVEALADRRLEKPKKMSSQSSRYWSEIISQQYNFDRDSIEVAYLKTLKKEDILNFYKNLLAHDAPKRHKLSVHIVSTASTSPDDNSNQTPTVQVDGTSVMPPMGEPEEIKDISYFKRCLPLFPLPAPYNNRNNAAKSKL
ncbi:hypothetical protein LSH36_39g02052 [Paralvinella palmiformis]|uniref:Insulin-degrading enzyme n=1 Tax=Paralvinella palmiformis TaxID=53620 RepID=A0AAD9K9C1_9ANNE|nr:hypothetical protein LSH36_39g02052 [Paralvinella palmiformis]